VARTASEDNWEGVMKSPFFCCLSTLFWKDPSKLIIFTIFSDVKYLEPIRSPSKPMRSYLRGNQWSHGRRGITDSQVEKRYHVCLSEMCRSVRRVSNYRRHAFDSDHISEMTKDSSLSHPDHIPEWIWMKQMKRMKVDFFLILEYEYRLIKVT
jgi:hypothetical protein